MGAVLGLCSAAQVTCIIRKICEIFLDLLHTFPLSEILIKINNEKTLAVLRKLDESSFIHLIKLFFSIYLVGLLLHWNCL